MKWYIPSWNGDLRLVPDEKDEQKTLLYIEKPTEREKSIVGQLGVEFIKQGWIEELKIAKGLFSRKKPIEINAPVAKVGPVVAGIMRPGPAVLTGITFKDGQIITHSGSPAELAAVVDAATEGGKPADANTDKTVHQAEVLAQPEEKAKPKAAATVKRPTPCCPRCIPGSIGPAREVLLEFLNEEEHASWAHDRTIVVTGGLSGHRYLIAHRHTELAQRMGRICYDLEDEFVVHFHDWSVPPEEEVLATKLILEHREPWLRNEATCFSNNSGFYKNPFGGYDDGTADSAFTQGVGAYLQALVPR